MEFSTEIINKADLSDREVQVLCLICNAQSDKQIARVLAISIRTVEHHIEHIHQKLGVNCEVLNKRVAVLRMAIARGLIRMVCLTLSVSAAMQVDNQAVMSARVGVSRTVAAARRFD